MAKRSKRRVNRKEDPKNEFKEFINEENNNAEIERCLNESSNSVKQVGNENKDIDSFDFEFENHNVISTVHIVITDEGIPMFKTSDIEKILSLSYSGKDEYINRDKVDRMISISKTRVAPRFKEWFDELLKYLFGDTVTLEEPEKENDFILFEIGNKRYEVPRNIPSYEIKNNTLQALKWAWEQRNNSALISEMQGQVERQDLFIDEMKRQISDFTKNQSALLEEFQAN